MHRDIKASNMLLDQQGFLKICDFGISVVVPDEMWLNGECGSPLTTSPEVFRGDNYNHMVDWWALGIVIYQMLYTCSPFKIPN